MLAGNFRTSILGLLAAVDDFYNLRNSQLISFQHPLLNNYGTNFCNKNFCRLTLADRLSFRSRILRPADGNARILIPNLNKRNFRRCFKFKVALMRKHVNPVTAICKLFADFFKNSGIIKFLCSKNLS